MANAINALLDKKKYCPYSHPDKPFPEVIPLRGLTHETIQRVCARLIKEGYTISLYNTDVLIHGVRHA